MSGNRSFKIRTVFGLKQYILQDGMVVQWLSLSPHSKINPGCMFSCFWLGSHRGQNRDSQFGDSKLIDFMR